ncbi:MAG TPA: alpha/beta hydrolase [Candidatus Polarisedimenticolaceae bacterium]|nr:alpha/beta hydrolase [Candidatus Polarisedimenticolaceae bacterium]
MNALAFVALAALTAGSPTERNLAYGTHPRQRLDLVVPETKGFPTVVFVHGGSLSTGDKADEDYGKVCRAFPAAGIACASVNYRLAADAGWPAQAEDVATALTWVRAHVAARGGDPDRLFLLGHSAGAMLVALVGTEGTAHVRGVVPVGSVMWDEEAERVLKTHSREEVEAAFARSPDNRMYASLDAYLDHWPIRHVRAGMPPFLFLVAEEEQEHPPVLRTNRAFVERARALGNQADLIVLPHRTHMSAIRGLHLPGDEVFAIVRDFVLGKKP